MISERKISAKAMGWPKEAILEAVMKDKTQPAFLYRVIGMATSTKTYTMRDDPENVGEGLMGQFRAYNNDGVIIESAVCYLPGYINEQLIAALEVAKSADRTAGVQFAFDIYAKYDKESATSYVFLGENIGQEKLAPGGSAPDAIEEILGETLKALPGAPDQKKLK